MKSLKRWDGVCVCVCGSLTECTVAGNVPYFFFFNLTYREVTSCSGRSPHFPLFTLPFPVFHLFLPPQHHKRCALSFRHAWVNLTSNFNAYHQSAAPYRSVFCFPPAVFYIQMIWKSRKCSVLLFPKKRRKKVWHGKILRKRKWVKL